MSKQNYYCSNVFAFNHILYICVVPSELVGGIIIPLNFFNSKYYPWGKYVLGYDGKPKWATEEGLRSVIVLTK